MKIVGYMEGTNPDVLTHLLLEGYETIPLSNGFDNHGKYIMHLTTEDHISLIVGYLHKFIPISPRYSLTDILSSVKVYKIPVIFIVPKEMQNKADRIIADKGLNYRLSDPTDLSKNIFESLKREVPQAVP